MVAEEALFHLDAPIRRLCGPDVPAMGYALPLEEEYHVVAGRDGRRDARDGEVLMATTITMPQLGETVTEGTVAQWLKNVGDQRRQVRSLRRSLDRQGQRRSSLAGHRHDSRDARQRR